MLTSPWTRPFRNFTRQLGLNKLLASLFHNNKYEDRFGSALLEQILPGDIVWDIGANVGLYTEQFLTKVEGSGKVVAFEPTPSCFKSLTEKLSAIPQAILINIAMGSSDGEITMSIENDPLAATHRIVESVSSPSSNVINVSIRSASSLISESPNLFPDVVKIDVEGHEGAVIDGMTPLLSDTRLRCIGIEVHFGLLEQRGEGKRPQQIEQTLKDNGFQVSWTDPSHLMALR